MRRSVPPVVFALSVLVLVTILPFARVPDPLWASLAGWVAGGWLASRSGPAGRPMGLHLALTAGNGMIAGFLAGAGASILTDAGLLLREIAYRLLYFGLFASPIVQRLSWLVGEIPGHLLQGLLMVVPGGLLGLGLHPWLRETRGGEGAGPADRRWIAFFTVIFLLAGARFLQEDRQLRERSRQLVPVPYGTFSMGCDGWHADERPVHSVSMRSFRMDRHEVTIASYDEFLRATGGTRPPGWSDPERPFTLRPHEPVEAVTWDEATAYARFRGRRLPTEAEWEYAARGGDGRLYPWGSDFSPTFFNGGGRSLKVENTGALDPRNPDSPTGGYGLKENRPAIVGSHPGDRSPAGIMDMAGNVCEWVGDAYDPGAYSRPSPGGTEKVIRGGDYGGSSAARARLTRRDHAPPDVRLWGRGFRTAQ